MKISQIIREEISKHFNPRAFRVGHLYYLLFFDLLSHVRWFGVHFPSAVGAGVLRRTAFGLDIDVFTVEEEKRWRKKVEEELGTDIQQTETTQEYQKIYEKNIKDATDIFLECRNRIAQRIGNKIKNLPHEKRQILHNISRNLIDEFNGLPSAHQRIQFEAGLNNPTSPFPSALADNMPDFTQWLLPFDWMNQLEKFDNLLG
jgi:hypothetical protein